MSLQSIHTNPSFLENPQISNQCKNKKNQTNSPDCTIQNRLSATIKSNYFSSNSLSMEYTSSDGDKVTFSYESIEYGNSVIQLQMETDPEKIKELALAIKDEFLKMKSELLKINFGSESVDDIEKSQKALNINIPEYWNAENTSQRIVDFSVSFFGVVDVENEEYYNQVKSAIQNGFQQAKELLGELPEEIAALIDETYDLSMQKLDLWAQEKGINIEPEAA